MENDLFQEMQQDALDSKSAVESTNTGRLSDVSELASKIIQAENKVKFLEEELKDTKKQLLELTDQDLPAAMEEINLERKKAGSHMAFGSGVHHCLGAPLARRELYWGFKAALDSFDDMWFSEGKNDFEYHPHYLLRSLKELHIEFTPNPKR